MRELVGQGHLGVVDLLVGRVAAVAGGDVSVPRVLILEGPSGVGKSRVVREVYRRMRADYDHEGYWPDLPEDFQGDSPVGDPLAGRKDIGPAVDGFCWPAGVLPGFGWWQLHCDRIHAGAVDVAAQVRPELEAHLVPMALAWARAATIGQRLAARGHTFADLARDAAQEGTLEKAAELLEKVDIVVPGLGMAVSWTIRGAKAGRNRLQQHQDLHTEIDLGQRAEAARRSVSADLAALITGVTHPELPGIVVIEDLHLMDAALAELLDRLSTARPTNPVVVIATAWPTVETTGAYRIWRTTAVADGRAQIVTMPELTDQDLQRMVRFYAPNTPPEMTQKAARQLSTPLMLEAILTSPPVRKAVATNGDALPEAALRGLPQSVIGVYEKRFRALSDEVQRGLAIAAGAVPTPTSATLWPFVRDVVAEAAHRCGLVPDASDLLTSIESAAQDRVWLTPSGVADTFREALQAHIAYDHLTDPYFIGLTAADDIRDHIHTVLIERIDTARDGGYLLDASEEAAILSRWLLELAS